MKLKRILSGILGVCLAITLCPWSGMSAEAESIPLPDNDAIVEGEIIVVYDDGAEMLAAAGDGVSLLSETAPEDLAIASEEVIADSLGDTGAITKVTLEDGVDMDAVLDELNAKEGVAYAQPNFRYELLATDLRSLTNDPYVNYQYYLGDWDSKKGANVAGAWNTAKVSKRVTIAIIDSGVNALHPDLRANLDTAHMVDVSTGDPGTPGVITDPVGHGTHVAGIAGAVADNGQGIAGASYNANILPIKVVYKTSSGKYSTDTEKVIAAFYYLEGLIRSGALSDLRVINMSLGSYDASGMDTTLNQLITKFRNSYNVLSVCAGGNGINGVAQTRPCYPSDFSACLSVTALDANGNNSVWSDYNGAKDISAPGNNIYSTYTNTAGYGYQNGTSMASPLVAGIAALLWADNPNLRVSAAVEAITATAKKLNPTGANYHSTSQTGSAGAIDAAAALAYLRGETANTTTPTQPTTPTETPKEPVKVSLSTASVSVSDCAYTGVLLTPAVNVTCQGRTLVRNTDYTVSYLNNLNAGTATVTVNGIGSYTGTKTAAFSIYRKLDSSTVSFDGIPDQEVTGKAVTPLVTAYYKNPRTGLKEKLTLNTDYALTYSDNVKPASGRATVKITGKGNYRGTASTTFLLKEPAQKANLTFPKITTGGRVTVFKDITSSHWLNREPASAPGQYLYYVYKNGIMTGIGNGLFGENAKLTRGQIATVLYRLAMQSGGTDVAATRVFSDVNPSAYYGKAVAWCYKNGIIKGYGNTGTFGPENTVTREQLCTMIGSFAAYAEGVGTSMSGTGNFSRFKDGSACSDWAKAGVSWCVDNGIISGVSSGGGTYLQPQGSATRAQAVKIIAAMVKAV